MSRKLCNLFIVYDHILFKIFVFTDLIDNKNTYDILFEKKVPMSIINIIIDEFDNISYPRDIHYKIEKLDKFIKSAHELIDDQSRYLINEFREDVHGWNC